MDTSFDKGVISANFMSSLFLEKAFVNPFVTISKKPEWIT
jgi:hypothetical protein